MDYSDDPLAQSGRLTLHEVEQWRQGWIRTLYPTLQGGIWHCTSPDCYRAIMREGYIKPNDGSIPCMYPQTPHYFGYQNGYISLFDFGAANEEDTASVESTWSHFFGDYEPVTVVLEIDRSILSRDLVPNEVAQKAEGTPKRGFIWYVEAWSKNRIPVSSVSRRLLVMSHKFSEEATYQLFEKANAHEFDEVLYELIMLHRKCCDRRLPRFPYY